jgi:TIR domain
MRAAQRKAEAQLKREIDRVNRENQRKVDAYNRKAEQRNRRVIEDYNREVDRLNGQNRRAAAHNQAVIAELNRGLRSATAAGPNYTVGEQQLADRVIQAAPARDDREWDAFLSYARIDGSEVGHSLRERLEEFGVRVWFDEVTITPGKSQALQMDRGLKSARCGIALLTPAYLAGRFWTERELGALLHKETLIPVLHNVTFDEVAEYSGILPDLVGFETHRDSVEVIAEKIAAAVLAEVPIVG